MSLSMNVQNDNDLPKKSKRVAVMYGIAFIAFSSLIARMAFLQITKGDYYKNQATNYEYVKVSVLPVRGRVYDTNGNLLAYDKPVYSAYLTKTSKTSKSDLDVLATKLAPILKMKKQDLVTAMSDDKYAQARIATNLNESQITYILEHKTDLAGIDIVAESQREYPFGDLAGQVLGYTGKITKETEAKYSKQGYINTQTVGVSGLEVQYEKQLQGKVGTELTSFNPYTGSTVNMGFAPAPVPGADLKLTLDANVQATAQEEILNTINQSQYKNDITDASAVAIDVKTGGILAMASYPYLDPNWYVDGSYSKHLNYLTNTTAQMNHTIQSPMYPGSTVKPANLIEGLKLGLVSMVPLVDHMITTIGSAHLSDDGMSHGLVGPVKAIGVSCDTYFYELGLQLGNWYGNASQKWLNTDYAKGITNLFQGEADFGLGQLTGIDLPNENKGIYYVEDARKHMNVTSLNLKEAEASIKKTGQYPMYGSPVDLAFAGIGQSQQFTPIELAQYVATIANGGKKLQPHLVQEIDYKDGRKPDVIQPVVQSVINAKPEYFQMAQQGMYYAVNQPDGTAYGVFSADSYKAAGKTGTAEIMMHGKKVDNSVFIAYAPYDHPQIAVAVMVPGAGYGAQAAAPVAEKIFNAYFAEHHMFTTKDKWIDPMLSDISWKKTQAYTTPEAQK